MTKLSENQVDKSTIDGKANVCASLLPKTGLRFTPASSVPGGAEDVLVSAEPVPFGGKAHCAFVRMGAAGEVKARHKGYEGSGRWAGAATIYASLSSVSTAGSPVSPPPSGAAPAAPPRAPSPQPRVRMR